RGLAVRRLAPLQKGRQLGRIDAGRWWVRNVGASAEARVGGTSPDVLVVLGVAAADRAVDAVHEPAGGVEETFAPRGVHRGRGGRRLAAAALVDRAVLLTAQQVGVGQVLGADLGEHLA